MEECKLKWVKKAEKQSKNIVSVSFFTFKTAYKPVEYYGKGLKMISDVIEKKEDIMLRVFYDSSIKKENETIKEIKENKRTELIYCDCDEIIPEEKRYFFMSIMRFMCYFDYEENKGTTIFVTDIDMSENKKEDYINYILSDFEKIIKEKIDFYYKYAMCYKPFWKKELETGVKISSIILGGYNGGKGKIDKKIFIKFIKSFMRNDDKFINKYKKIYKNYIKNPKIKENYKEKKKSTISLKGDDYGFNYGFDEFFLNYYIFPEMLKYKKICYRKSHPQGHIYILLLTSLKKNKETEEFIKKYDSRFKTVKEFIEYFKIPDYEGKDKEKQEIYNNFIKKIKEKGRNLIDKDRYNCLMENEKYITEKNMEKCIEKEERKKIIKEIEKLKN